MGRAGRGPGLSHAARRRYLEGRDGACQKNTLATYTHTHALGTPAWAEAVVRMARSYRQGTPKREESN